MMSWGDVMPWLGHEVEQEGNRVKRRVRRQPPRAGVCPSPQLPNTSGRELARSGNEEKGQAPTSAAAKQ